MERQGFRNKVFGGFAALGPGIITAALVFGPSKITITSKLGASYGHDMLWIVVLAIFFMVIFTNMGARIGLSSPLSLLTLIRNKWGKAIGISIGLGVFLVSTSFQAGNSIGVGLAVAEASHTPIWLWILVFNSLGIGLLFFKSFYKILEKLMIGLVGIMLFSFTLTLFMVKPSFEGVMSGFIPSIPDGSAGLMIAFMASCFSIVGAFYQAYLIQEKRKINIPQKNRSSSGILILGVMSAVVIICAATVLHPQGIQVSSASEMSIALEPLFGSNAAHLFLVGLFGASFSSLVGNATVGGSLLADALGFGHQLHLKRVKYCIALVMVAGASIALIFGNLPLELIIFAQRVTIFLVPIIGLSMFMIANDKGLMKDRVNTTAIKFGGIAGIMLLVGLAIWNFGELFNN